MGLGDRLSHYPAQLSGGEQQRVALARALCPRPSLLIADEPTGNLDETTGRAIIDMMFDLPARRGATLALVTHDAALASRCDRVIRMRSGRVEDDRPAVPFPHERVPRRFRCRRASRAPTLRFALRDLRGGLAGLRIFLLCIALGVAAIVGVESLARRSMTASGAKGA